MTDSKVVISGSAAEYIKEIQKLQKENEKLEKGWREQKKASQEAAREQKLLAQQAEKAIQSIQTPAQKYNETLKQYKKLLSEGKITEEQFVRLRDKELAQLNSLKKVTKEAAYQTTMLGKSQLDTNRTTGIALGGLKAYIAGYIGASGLISAIRQAIAENLKFEQSIQDTNLALDEHSRKFAVQAGLEGLSSNESKKKILGVALNNAATSETAFATATQLVSSGFSKDEAQGRSLDVVLKAMGSSNQLAADPAQFIQSASQFLAGLGKEKNAANLGELLVRTRGLFENTDVQVSDLGDFAKVAGVFSSSGVSLEDTLSTLTGLREFLDPAQAATAGRNIVQSMTSAGASKTKVEALERMGLQTTDVDLVGETLPEALGKIRKGIQSLPEEERQVVLTKFFEKETAGAASTLLGNLDRLPGFDKAQQGEEGFAAGVRISQSGINANLRRQEVKREMAALEEEDVANKREVYKTAINNAREQLYEKGNVFSDIAVFAASRIQDADILRTGDRSRFFNPISRANIEAGSQSNFSVNDLKELIGATKETNTILRNVERGVNNHPKQNPAENLNRK